jgi:hypothetical protein
VELLLENISKINEKSFDRYHQDHKNNYQDKYLMKRDKVKISNKKEL